MSLQLNEEMLSELVQQFEIGTLTNFEREGEQSGSSKLVTATKSVKKTLKKVAKKGKKIINSVKLERNRKLVGIIKAKQIIKIQKNENA